MSERTSMGTLEAVVEVEGLTRRFGKKTLALDGVSLRVPKGCVFGLVGENGAGKTTLIKHLLGGNTNRSRARFGCSGNRRSDAPEKVLAGVGYLSEDHDLPGWMRIDELINYTQAFYPDWDDDLHGAPAEDLRVAAGSQSEDLVARPTRSGRTAYRAGASIPHSCCWTSRRRVSTRWCGGTSWAR